MKTTGLTLYLITILILVSCNNPGIPKENQNTSSEDKQSKQLTLPPESKKESLIIHDKNLLSALNKITNLYPEDSSSIVRFYSNISSKNSLENKKYINRIEGLISKDKVEMYYLVHHNLKPLMISMIESDTINISQAYEFAKYYSFYDDFQGEGLFHNLISDDENYSLVWESLKRITETPIRDTSYISLMIDLNKKIRTNAELAEAMEDFVIESIKNDPVGFLEMFLSRKPEMRQSFSDNICYFETPDSTLLKTYKEIASSKNLKYKDAAIELLEYLPNIIH